MAIRIVLAEDEYLVREGLRRLLDTQGDLEVVSVCEDLASLLDTVDAERPDVVVTDIRMPPGHTDEGIQAATRLRETSPGVGVVVLSQHAVPSYVLALLEGGSEGRAYLLKERVSDLDQLVTAIRAVAAGGSVFDPKVVEALVADNARSESSPLNELTPRERDVLREMAEGKNNAAIAGALVLTERSVEKVIHSIFLKLGLTWETAVHKRVKAVVLFLAESGYRHRSIGSEHATTAAPRREDAIVSRPPRASTRPRRASSSVVDSIPGVVISKVRVSTVSRTSIDVNAPEPARASVSSHARWIVITASGG